jgi:hypothetical protein
VAARSGTERSSGELADRSATDWGGWEQAGTRRRSPHANTLLMVDMHAHDITGVLQSASARQAGCFWMSASARRVSVLPGST